MRQEELIAFIITRGSVTSAEVAKEFKIPVTFAHQSLRRLKDKGILVTNGGPVRYSFELSPDAQSIVNSLTEKRDGRAWIFLLGVALGLLIGVTARAGSNNAKSKKRKH